MIKVKKSTPKEATVNISLDESTAGNLLIVLHELTSTTEVASNVAELIEALEEIL